MGKIVGLLFLGAVGLLLLLDRVSTDRVSPRVVIAGTSYGLKKFDSVREDLSKRLLEFEERGVNVTYKDTSVALPFSYTTDDLGFSRELMRVDVEQALSQAYAIGHDPVWWRRWSSRTVLFIFPAYIELPVELDQERIKEFLSQNFSKYESPASDAQLTFTKQGAPYVLPEKEGLTLHYEQAFSTLQQRIQNLSFEPLLLQIQSVTPAIRKEQTGSAVAQVETFLSQVQGEPLEVTLGEKSWKLDRATLIQWLAFSQELGRVEGEVTIALRSDAVRSFLENVAKEVNEPAQNGKFEVRDGKVVEFQPRVAGKVLDIEKNLEQLSDRFIHEGARRVELAVQAIEPPITSESLFTESIKERIGVGVTDFKGSPKNRVHNIRVGAAILHGTLIAPDEEFSLIETLGDFGPEDGWLPELVIKENKTIPEYGGGACQFGSTTFRAALASGLPILERQNHSYVVSYYYDEEGKPGKDATIYDPKPDFRFVNDTGHYMLIQTRIEGTKFIVEFWGTSDGRKSQQSSTKVWGWVDPPPMKIIETSELPEGQKKCTEKARRGVSTSFDYTIVYPHGKVYKKTFSSRYKPWQAVCLIGKKT